MTDRTQPTPLPPEQQQRLFQAAAEEFTEQGFDGASLDRILARSGLNDSTFHDHFDDKADLFTRLVERSMVVLFHQIGPFDIDALTAETFWSALARAYHRAIALVDRNDWLVRFGRLFYTLRDDPRHSGPTDRLFDITRRWTHALILRGQTLGIVRDDLPGPLLTELAMGLLEPLDRWSVAHWLELSEDERQALPEKHIGLFRALLSPPSD